jgi:hypothetical protein
MSYIKVDLYSLIFIRLHNFNYNCQHELLRRIPSRYGLVAFLIVQVRTRSRGRILQGEALGAICLSIGLAAIRFFGEV